MGFWNLEISRHSEIIFETSSKGWTRGMRGKRIESLFKIKSAQSSIDQSWKLEKKFLNILHMLFHMWPNITVLCVCSGEPCNLCIISLKAYGPRA